MIGRAIRPRPLSYTERIPVIFLNRPKEGDGDDDKQPIEPALEQFLRTCEDEQERQQNGLLSGLETSRRRKKIRDHSAAQQQQPQVQNRNQAEGVAAGSGAGAGPSGSRRRNPGNGSCPDPHPGHQEAQQQPIGTGGAAAVATGIDVPTCREISDYGCNEEAMACADARKAAVDAAGPSVPLLAGILPDLSPCPASQGSLGGLDAAAYIIYQDLLRERCAEPALLQYDMDEEDENALVAVNTPRAPKPKPGQAAASRTPPTTRAATAAVAAVAAAVLDEDGFEALVGALERAHFEALQQRKELWQAEVKAGKVPTLPATEEILPWDAAVAAVKQHQPKLRPLPRALYNHWLKRRKQEGGPLLGYLWYKQPWKAICFQDRERGHQGEQGDIPFEVAETKNSTRGGGWNRIRIDKKEAYERLMEARDELELLRTTADQIRKRERLKKQLLKLYRAEVAAKLGLNLHGKHAVGAAAAAGTATATGVGGSKMAAGPAAAHAAGGAAAAGVLAPPAPNSAAAVGATAAGGAPAAAGGRADRPPPNKRRRIATDAPPPPRKIGKKAVVETSAATAGPAVAEPTAATAAAGAKGRPRPRQAEEPAAAAPAAAPRNARTAKAKGSAGKPAVRTASPPPPSASVPTSTSSSTASDSSGSSSSAAASSSESGPERGPDSGLRATGAAATGHGRRPTPAATAVAGARATQRRRSKAAERPLPAGRRSAAAAVAAAARVAAEEEDGSAASGDSGGTSGSAEAGEEESGRSGDGSGSSPASSLSGGSGGGAESSEVAASSGGTSGSGRESDEGGAESPSGASSAAGTSDEESESEAASQEDDEEEEEKHDAGAGRSQLGRTRCSGASQARSAGRAKVHEGAAADPCRLPDSVDEEAGVEAQEAEGSGGGRKGQRPGRGCVTRTGQATQQRQQLQQQQRRGRVRARSRSRAAASASPVRSASRSPAPSSSPSHSSSPSRSGADRRNCPSSSSPEPSRSPSRSPPRPRPGRRDSAPAAGAVASNRVGVVPPQQCRRRRLTVGANDDRRAPRQQVQFLLRESKDPGLATKAATGSNAGELKAARVNRELLSLLKMQRGGDRIAAELADGGGASGSAAAPVEGKAAADKRQRASGAAAGAAAAAGDTAVAAPPAQQQRERHGRQADAAAADGAARKVRSSTGCGVGGAASLTGSKRPLEATTHGTVAGTATETGGCPRKTRTGWGKELATLISKPFAFTSRFLLQRKQHQQPRTATAAAVAAAAAVGEPAKARDGSSEGDGGVTRGSARRTSMLRERNGAAS